MNESDFNGILGEENIWMNQICVSSSGRFNFFKTRIYGTTQFIKKVSEDYLGDALTLDSLKKEFAIGFSLNHPGIVRYFKYEDNTVYEEFIDGQTLRELIDAKDPRLFNKTFIEKIIVQILEILDYIHKSGVVHHDIKPENLIITRIGERVKIVDFGAAVTASNDSSPGYTLKYKAPEEDTDIKDCRSDIYQLGILLNEIESFKKNERGKRFIRRATKRHPDDRFQSAEEALIYFRNHKNNIINRLSLYTILTMAVGIGLFSFFRNNSDFFPSEPQETLNAENEEVSPVDSVVSSYLSAENVETLFQNIPRQIDQSGKDGLIKQREKVVEKQIAEEINQWVVNEFEKNVYTIINENKEFDNFDDFFAIHSSAEAQCYKILENADLFRLKLREKYPGKIGYIEEEISISLSENYAKYEQVLQKYYSRINVNESKHAYPDTSDIKKWPNLQED